MPNADIVKGAEPFGRLLRLSPYQAESTIYPGDFVKQNANGTVEQAAATNACIGVAQSYATAGQTVLVWDDPQQLFVLQSDDATVDAQTDIGLGYDIVVAAGNATYKRSGMELDGDSGGAGATKQLKLLRILPAVDNALGANVKCVVQINNHQLAGGTGTAGV